MGGISKKANGDNQTQVKTSAGIWTANYNAQNRPVRFTRENANGTRTVITAAYDYLGRRAWKKVETIATDPETGEETATVTLHQRYIYRGYLQVAACDLTRGVHPCLWLVMWDPTQPTATRPLAIQKDGTWYCYGWDLTKNICEVFGQAGYIRTTYAYTPYGVVTEEGDVAQPLQWSSEYADSELGLVYYNYRSYNPTDGRWIRRDPIGIEGGYNLYSYLSGRVYLTDCRGLFILGAISSMAIEFGVQIATNCANGKPMMDINYTDVLIAGVVGAIVPGVGSKFISNIVQSFKRAKKIESMVPKITKGHKLVYKKQDVKYMNILVEEDRMMWSYFAYEATTVSIYKQVLSKGMKEWCSCHKINDETIKEKYIIVTEKIKVEGKTLIDKLQEPLPYQSPAHPYSPYPLPPKYRLD